VTLTATEEALAPGHKPRKVSQKVTARFDGRGGFHVVKNTSPQYGTEVIFSGGWLYPRLRYGRFTRRRPRHGELARILDRLLSHLPAHLRLLGPSLVVTPSGETRVSGRPARKATLSLAAAPGKAPRPRGKADLWRRTVKVTSVKGEVAVDRDTGALLAADLHATLTFTPPRGDKPLPASGVPTALDEGHRGTMTLALKLRVHEQGEAKPVSPPPARETLLSVRRRRLELERQLFSGEMDIPDDWRRVP